MGGGGLVILKHKSWHVYNEKNREKVRKDEEKAKLEDDEKAARAMRADQERRLGILRSKSKSHKSDDAERTPGNQPSASSNDPEFGGKEGVHVNLFGELESERVQRKDGRNEEHEAEKAAEKAKFEKQFTMHLGDESVTGPTPWYAKDEPYADRHVSKKPKMEQQSLARNDPLAVFKSKDDDCSKRSKTKKDDKKRDKKKNLSKSKSIEQLRAERLSREGKERSRELELMRPSAPITTATEREMPYNSGFNPECQRKRNR
ncbi:Leukocyte receptor cluster member 1 [Chytriomyces hyalinus]|nr:Leukocyte receptor cluster member 1 [Chytriomyces hyalinus]